MNVRSGTLGDCQMEDLETPGLAEIPERPLHFNQDPLINGLGIGAQNRTSNRLNLHGEKGEIIMGSTNEGITEGEAIKVRAELGEANCLPEIESANLSFPEEEIGEICKTGE